MTQGDLYAASRLRPWPLAALARRLGHVWLAITSRPTRRDWLEAGAIFGGAATLGLWLALRSRLVRPEPMAAPWTQQLALASLLAVTPGLSEELLFRGVLLPHPREAVGPGGRLLALILSLAAFILWHPVNGRRPRAGGRHVFHDHRFLLQTGILGGACAVAYLRSGSIWPSVLMHWLTVTAWLLGLGGHRHLHEGVPAVIAVAGSPAEGGQHLVGDFEGGARSARLPGALL